MQAFEYKLFLGAQAVCRTPAFSPDDQLEDKFEELKSMIREASPAFFEVIASTTKEELIQQSDKIKYTLWKYFNRARYRATPFGKFSGISIVPYHVNGNLVLADSLMINYFTDWQAIEDQICKTAAALKESTEFILNASLYQVGNAYRYIYFDKGHFEIALVPNFPELDCLVTLCTQKQSKETIYRRLTELMNLNNSSINQLLSQLIAAQILIPDCTPNITGQDFFLRKPANAQGKKIIPYIIAERKLIRGGYNNQLQKGIPELVNFLNKHLPKNIHSDLQAFVNAFKKKFELRFIPLALAIDPETGIGYANLENPQSDNGITDLTARFRHRAADRLPQISYSPLLVFLLNKSMQGHIIHLDEFQGECLVAPPMLPNTFSVVLHHCNSYGVIEHIGGATANSLIGRFSISIPAVEEMGRGLSAIEQEANPDILFFDVAYQAERHIDNVNRRKSLYDYELPILSWSCLDEPLQIGDILVGIHNNEVILYSRKYRKRMIPRIPSAYNYHRSDLPLFRFLCDLQHQSIRTKLNFRLSELLPGLEHYSRVVFKNLIVSPEMWRLPDKLIADLTTAKQDAKPMIKHWLEQIGLNVPFTVGQGDQTLVVTPTVDEDLTQFAVFCRKNADQPIYLSEALLTKDTIVANESGKPLAAQLISNYFHKERVYHPIPQNMRGIKYSLGHDMIPPGNDWLYFAIYGHPARFDDLLKNAIAKFVKTYRKAILKWFYIRFEDNGQHLRLRLKMQDSKQTFLLMEALQQMLQSHIQAGIITDIQVKSYFPETARYGKERLSDIEDFFHRDSRYALALLNINADGDIFYRIVLENLRRLIAAGFTEDNERIDFVRFMALTYSKEFEMNPGDYKLINRRSDVLKGDLPPINSRAIPARIKKLEIMFAKIIGRTQQVNDRYTLAADLLHMHINRLFPFDQRAHEAIIYQQLFSLLKSQDFLAKQQVTEAVL